MSVCVSGFLIWEWWAKSSLTASILAAWVKTFYYHTYSNTKTLQPIYQYTVLHTVYCIDAPSQTDSTPRPLLSAAGDPIHPPTHSLYLFISTSWGRVSSFPCRRSLLLPLLLFPFLLFHSSFPGNWVWVLAVGGKRLGWSCWELCVCVVSVCVCVYVYVCVLGSELIKDGDPWKALSKDTVNYLMPGPDRRAHAHTFSF